MPVEFFGTIFTSRTANAIRSSFSVYANLVLVAAKRINRLTQR